MIEAADELRRQLQASEALALPQLQPFDTELNYLCYPVGGHYKRHLDQPYGDSGWVQKGRRASNGGSFCGSRTRRVVSFILYLNGGWDAADGGALRVFPAYERGWGMPESQLADYTEDVLPEGGTLVVLLSGDVEHLVRETRRERQCVVGWLNERASLRVPDLDCTSLRTLRMLDRKTTSNSCRALASSELWP